LNDVSGGSLSGDPDGAGAGGSLDFQGDGVFDGLNSSSVDGESLCTDEGGSWWDDEDWDGCEWVALIRWVDGLAVACSFGGVVEITSGVVVDHVIGSVLIGSESSGDEIVVDFSVDGLVLNDLTSNNDLGVKFEIGCEFSGNIGQRISSGRNDSSGSWESSGAWSGGGGWESSGGWNAGGSWKSSGAWNAGGASSGGRRGGGTGGGEWIANRSTVVACAISSETVQVDTWEV